MQTKFSVRAIEALCPAQKPYEARDTELPGLLIRVQPSGKRTFYADFRTTQGKRKRVKVGRVEVMSLAQARDQARIVLGAVAKGEDPAVQKKRDRQTTFGIFLEGSYGPWANANHSRGNTGDRLRALFGDFLSCRLDEITPWKAERWIMDRKKAGIAGSTINRDVGMLKSALSKAVEWGLLPIHPLIALKAQRTDQTGKVRYLSEEEEVRLMAALTARETRRSGARESGNAWRLQRGRTPMKPIEPEQGYTDHLLPMVLISLNTGLRQGELFSLTWENMDLAHRRLTVQGSRAKSGQTRHIPLNRTAFEALSRLKERSGAESVVFVGRGGERFNNVKRSWQRVLQEARITHFRWHDMRHHFASRLVQRGTDLNTVRVLLGHKDIKMTLRYAHLSPQVMADAVARLDPSPVLSIQLAQ
jgi:integrase